MQQLPEASNKYTSNRQNFLTDTVDFLYTHTQARSFEKIAMKKALGETQTLRAGCSKAEPKIFAPPQTSFPEAQYSQNAIRWRRSLPSPTDPVW